VTVHGNGITGAVGGIPLYFNGQIAGGIGVDGTGSDEDEVIALAGASGIYAPPDAITGDKINVNGIQLVFIGVPIPASLTPIPFTSLPNFGSFAPGFGVIGTPATNYPAAVFAGVPGEIRFTIRDSPLPGPVKLTATDVVAMITNAVAEARITRAAIRQPIGVPARMQVGVTDTAGNILGVFRMNDATMFSLDIVIQKGRSVTAFSDPTQPLGQLIRSDLGLDPNSQVAFTTRTLGFLAQPFYPPGIDESQPGPLFQIQEQLFAGANPCAPYTPGNGVTLFPGSVPLYKSGILVGGLGISGDGVDQDDFVTFSGGTGFLPDFSIRADNIIFRGTNLPFLKFPRHPTL